MKGSVAEVAFLTGIGISAYVSGGLERAGFVLMVVGGLAYLIESIGDDQS